MRERTAVAYRAEGRVTARLPLDDETSPEMFITIGERERDHEDPVTVVELLSPSNKTSSGHGRSQYLDKRQRVIFSDTHLVEIDLIRRGRPMPVEGYDGDAPYRHLISRWQTRPGSGPVSFPPANSHP